MWCNGPTNAGKPLAPATPAPRPVAASKPAAVVTTAARPAAYRLVAFISKRSLPMEDVSTHGHVPGSTLVRIAATHQPVTITVIVSPGRVSAVHMDIRPGVAEVGVARRGGLALAVCAAGLLLTAPAVQAAPRIPHTPPGLPGP